MNPAKYYLGNFSHASAATKPLIEQVKAMLELGITSEAQKLLLVAPDGMHPEPDLEALRLACLDQLNTPSETLCALALRTLDHRSFAFGSYLVAITHLLNQGRHQDVLQLEQRFRSSRLTLFGQACGIVACAATRLGRYAKALETLSLFYSRDHPAGLLLADSRLSALWDHYAQVRPSLEEAHNLCSSRIGQEINVVAAPQFHAPVGDFEHRHLVPHRLRPWLERNLGGTWIPKLEIPTAERRAFQQWNRERVQHAANLLKRALARAETVCLQSPDRPPPTPPKAPHTSGEGGATEAIRKANQAFIAALHEEMANQAQEQAPVIIGRSSGRHR